LPSVLKIRWVMLDSVPSTFAIMCWATRRPPETIEKGIELVQKAIAMDDSISGAHAILCAFYFHTREHDKAIAEGERAVALNPRGTSELNNYAVSLTYAGRAGGSHSVIPESNPIQPLRGLLFISRLRSRSPGCGAV
jgi:hypothetical protein